MAPPFKSLLDAINRVLEKEDVPLEQRTTPLSQAECAHIASELAWNRTTHPPPDDPSPQDLSQWYTTGKTSDQEEQRRQKFEGQLKAYEAALRSEALRLSNFIYSLSAAYEAERRTWKVTKAAFTFPIHTPANSTSDTSVATGTVIVATQDDAGTAELLTIK
ncbi:hypothetical protein BKA66DRAFT_479640 [Pyrenochaeta sp. MPI-SDFR-AT-0127]|nr:hypothetical protein BKA66DRAFT_479640 [Pyrenochaeta sp. MPI-SDFR-AT-0127]